MDGGGLGQPLSASFQLVVWIRGLEVKGPSTWIHGLEVKGVISLVPSTRTSSNPNPNPQSKQPRVA